MPKYHKPPQNWWNRGNITIIPQPFWRRYNFLNLVIPYRVGDRVSFIIKADNPDKSNSFSANAIIETFNGKVRDKFPIPNTYNPITGNIINAEGDVEYSLGHTTYTDQATHTIFTARVENWDTVISNWKSIIIGAILGALFGLAIAILTGLVEIAPKWRLLP
jgi:hypothetical protein